MISMFSTYLSLLLLKEQIITADDEEIYKYGFEITIANMVNGIIILLIGIGFHKLPETFLFYLAFVSLRFFCGGYHADSYQKCFLYFTITGSLCIMASEWISRYEKATIVLFFSATAALWLCIFKKAPVEHENRPLTQKEELFFRKRSMQICGFWSMVGIVLCMAHQMQMTASLISTFIVVTILMTGGEDHEKRSA